MDGLVSVDGGAGMDLLRVDDSGETSDDSGQLTPTSITGLGMAQGIDYGTVEQVELLLGQGDDQFSLHSATDHYADRRRCGR